MGLVLVIVALAIRITLLGIYIINIDIIDRAEKQVLHDLKAARLVYNSELERLRRNFKLVTFDELIKLNNSLKESTLIKIIPTPRATPTGRLELQNVMAKSIILLYMGIIGGVSVLAVILAFIIAAGMTKHLTDMLRAMRTISEGILALAVVNAYALKGGLLGLINFKPRKAIDSMARNLDYLTTTVQKFLNLGVIERGQLKANKTKTNLNKDVFTVSLDTLSPPAARKNIKIANKIPDNLEISADGELMQIVANNLLSNAIKYSYKNGNDTISSVVTNDKCTVEVFNESDPISEDEAHRRRGIQILRLLSENF